MPYSVLVQGYPHADIPINHVQGTNLQGMFLELIESVDPELAQHLHDDPGYRPYTLSPLGIADGNRYFQEQWLPRYQLLKAGTLCYFRATFLDDKVFPAFSSYFLSQTESRFPLGSAMFTVKNVLTNRGDRNPWARYESYQDLLRRAEATDTRQITLRFFTPTSFRSGDVDLPVPVPRLILGSYLKRFQGFCQASFPEDIFQQIESLVAISSLRHINTHVIKTNKVPLIGFTGIVTMQIRPKASDELVAFLNFLADYAFYGGTGKKTTVGMGQTQRLRNHRNDRTARRSGSGRRDTPH